MQSHFTWETKTIINSKETFIFLHWAFVCWKRNYYVLSNLLKLIYIYDHLWQNQLGQCSDLRMEWVLGIVHESMNPVRQSSSFKICHILHWLHIFMKGTIILSQCSNLVFLIFTYVHWQLTNWSHCVTSITTSRMFEISEMTDTDLMSRCGHNNTIMKTASVLCLIWHYFAVVDRLLVFDQVHQKMNSILLV